MIPVRLPTRGCSRSAVRCREAARLVRPAARCLLSNTALIEINGGAGTSYRALGRAGGTLSNAGLLVLEQMLHWADARYGMRSACLRYFNAAGADPAGRAGEDHRPESHLIPAAIDAALGRRPPLALFGDDYPTPDGTCIRDYVHVSDLAEAHLQVLPLLDGASWRLNVGTGQGHSVREVIASVERVTGRLVPVEPAPRRPGDPPALVADATLLRRVTEWSPRHAELDAMVRTACAWRLAHPAGYDPL
jgi:UDP-glucose 4-epimerase